MRRMMWGAAAVVVVLGALALRTPTASLVQLKLAIDRHDLAAVERRVDEQALASEALAGLVENDAQPVRLAIRGDEGWLPAIQSARSWLRLRIDRAIERLVEDPASGFSVTWEQLEDTLDSLDQSGATASFRFIDADGAAYAVRMRQGWWHWRIVSISQDGQPLLLVPTPQAEQTAAVAEQDAPVEDVPVSGIVTEPPADVALDEHPVEEPQIAEPAPLPRLAPMVTASATTTPPAAPSARSHWTPGGRPFVRRLDGTSWTVQVGSSTDALAAAVQRDRIASQGESATVQAVTVRGTQWHRVLVGAFPTKREADQVAVRLGAGSAN